MKELLKKVLNYTIEKYSDRGEISDIHRNIKDGLCWIVIIMEREYCISIDDKNILFDYIRENRPVYKHNYYWGWERGLLEPRLEWLQEEIKNQKT